MKQLKTLKRLEMFVVAQKAPIEIVKDTPIRVFEMMEGTKRLYIPKGHFAHNEPSVGFTTEGMMEVADTHLFGTFEDGHTEIDMGDNVISTLIELGYLEYVNE